MSILHCEKHGPYDTDLVENCQRCEKNSQLLCCPFCGGHESVEVMRDDAGTFVICAYHPLNLSCGCRSGSYDNWEQAISAWNSRTATRLLQHSDVIQAACDEFERTTAAQVDSGRLGTPLPPTAYPEKGTFFQAMANSLKKAIFYKGS